MERANFGIRDQLSDARMQAPPITIETPDARASFRRIGADAATMAIKLETPGFVAPMVGMDVDSVRSAFDAIRDAEIEHNRRAFAELAAELLPRLDSAGEEPIGRRDHESNEERRWAWIGRGIAVQPTATTIEDHIRCREGTSDAKLAKLALDEHLKSRIDAIRSIHEQLLRSAIGEGGRDSRPKSSLDRGSSVDQ